MKLITEQFQGQNVHHFVFELALKEEKMHTVKLFLLKHTSEEEKKKVEIDIHNYETNS